MRPDFHRDPDDLTMGVTFAKINQAPRVYVERIDVNGNTLTQDKVVRREFRIAEGDAFNSLQVKRSTNRIKSLGYFQEKFEVEQKPGSAPDRIILEANVEEKPTGELQLSAGFSSIESFIFQASVQQRNFRGRGQTIGLSVSNYSTLFEVGRSGLHRAVSVRQERLRPRRRHLFRRDYNSFNFEQQRPQHDLPAGDHRRAASRWVVPINRVFVGLVGAHTALQLRRRDARQVQFYYTDTDGNGTLPIPTTRCSPAATCARRSSSALTSMLGRLFAGLRQPQQPLPPDARQAGQRVVFSSGFRRPRRQQARRAYIKTAFEATKYWGFGSGFIFSIRAESGFIKGWGQNGNTGDNQVLLTDRFFLGEPEMRGFGITAASAPASGAFALLSSPMLTAIRLCHDRPGKTDNYIDDALGGSTYYKGRLELEIAARQRRPRAGPAPVYLHGRRRGLRRQGAGLERRLQDPAKHAEQLHHLQTADDRRQRASQLYYNRNPASYRSERVTPSRQHDRVPGIGARRRESYPLPPRTNPALLRAILRRHAETARFGGASASTGTRRSGRCASISPRCLVKANGGNTKLITFNVGTQF